MLASWCELRRDFRAFRVERISALKTTGDTFRDEPGKTMEDFVARPQTSSTERSAETKKAGHE
jgi:predicted DNA-binding transcriptional regulator YafY